LVFDREIDRSVSKSFEANNDTIIQKQLIKQQREKIQLGIKSDFSDDDLVIQFKDSKGSESLTFMNRGAIAYIFLAITFSIVFLIKSLVVIENIPTITHTANLLNLRHINFWEW
jgi:hypothetical protein